MVKIVYTHFWMKSSLEDYSITVKYPAKLKCDEAELVAEFNSHWPAVSKKWLKFKESKPSSTRMKRFWHHILEEHSVEYPNLADLLLILL